MLKSFEGRERDRKHKYATAKKLTIYVAAICNIHVANIHT